MSLQVRYDSHLGGFDDAPSATGYTYRRAAETAAKWHNMTQVRAKREDGYPSPTHIWLPCHSQAHCRSASYASRNARKWAAVAASPQLPHVARHHPLEGRPDDDQGGPFARHCVGEASVAAERAARAQRAVLSLPSSQLAHVSALLPGYSYVHVPGQLYLE